MAPIILPRDILLLANLTQFVQVIAMANLQLSDKREIYFRDFENVAFKVLRCYKIKKSEEEIKERCVQFLEGNISVRMKLVGDIFISCLETCRQSRIWLSEKR